jgi:hypothetical protein
VTIGVVEGLKRMSTPFVYVHDAAFPIEGEIARW